MKVLLLMTTKGETIDPECYDSLLNQDFKDYSVMNHIMFPIPIRVDDPERNRFYNIVRNRNYMRKMALSSPAEWFLWLDSDVAMPKTAISEFLKAGFPLMGGWYKKKGVNDWVANYKKGDVFVYYTQPQHGVIDTDLIGLGCVMMHRTVLEKQDFKPFTELGMKDDKGNNYFFGECFGFTQEAKSMGIKPKMVGSIVCKHNHK